MERLDADTIAGDLIVRPRGPGDRFRPLGSSGSRKVGKFLTDCKLTPGERSQVAIVADRDKIVWIAPHRLDDRVKLTPATQRVLELRVRIA